jgi:hypothetical protein
LILGAVDGCSWATARAERLVARRSKEVRSGFIGKFRYSLLRKNLAAYLS